MNFRTLGFLGLAGLSVTACGGGVNEAEVLAQLNDVDAPYLKQTEVYRTYESMVSERSSISPKFGDRQRIRFQNRKENLTENWFVYFYDCESFAEKAPDLVETGNVMLRPQNNKYWSNVSWLSKKMCLVEFPNAGLEVHLGMEVESGALQEGYHVFSVTTHKGKYSSIKDIIDFDGEGCKKRATAVVTETYNYERETNPNVTLGEKQVCLSPTCPSSYKMRQIQA